MIKKAVGDKNKSGKLFLSSDNTGDHRTYKYNSNSKYKSINICTLDGFFSKNVKNMKVDVIKMDIQGSEMQAFNGSRELLKYNKHIKIFTEFWSFGLRISGDNDIKYYSSLKKAKFKISSINEKERKLIPVNAYSDISNNDNNFTNLMCVR